jgi:hypothetical protein
MTDDPIDLAAERGKRQGGKRGGGKRKAPAPASPEGSPPDGDTPAPPGERPSDPGAPPVQPVGVRGAVCYFFDSLGQLREVTAQALGQPSQVIFLFGGSDAAMTWLRHKFPHFDKEGNWTKGFSTRECNAWLVDQCHRRGLVDPDRLPARGHGVWRAQGAVAVHVGSKVIFIAEDGRPLETRDAGFAARGALWPAQADLIPPAPAASAETAQQVERLFAKWNWWNLGEERVFTGLFAAGLLGAAITWRPHGLIVGPAGTGKSTLLELYCALSPLALPVNDYTAAGVRQLLTGRAAPLILDEADEDPETMGRLQQVLSLLRRASGGEGARVVRGSGEGKAMTYTFTSPAILGSVLAPPLMPQDATRITKMELVAIPEGTAPLPIEDMMAWAKKHAPALWGRAIAGIPRFRHNLGVVRAALLARGGSPRLCDQLGTILAARAMLLEDEPLDARAADDDVASIGWLLQSRGQAIEETGSMRCLQDLLTSTAELESGERPTFERLISRALKGDDNAKRRLIDHGMKLTRYPARAIGVRESLLVARSHSALTKVFAGTAWSGNRHGDALKHLPGASVPADSVSLRFGVKARVVVIPLEILPGADATPDDLPPPAPDPGEDVPL